MICNINVFVHPADNIAAYADHQTTVRDYTIDGTKLRIGELVKCAVMADRARGKQEQAIDTS